MARWGPYSQAFTLPNKTNTSCHFTIPSFQQLGHYQTKRVTEWEGNVPCTLYIDPPCILHLRCIKWKGPDKAVPDWISCTKSLLCNFMLFIITCAFNEGLEAKFSWSCALSFYWVQVNHPLCKLLMTMSQFPSSLYNFLPPKTVILLNMSYFLHAFHRSACFLFSVWQCRMILFV